MGSAQGKLVEVGDRKLTVKAQLKSGKDKSLFLVRDNDTNQTFVLKRSVVKKGLNNVLARAKWEADLYAKVPKHKNLLSCYGLKRFLNKDGDAENLLILEYCSGGSLKQVLQRRGEPFTVPQALTCLRSLSSCVAFLHSQDPPIIHLGIRTDNVFLHENGQWKLGDFGCSAVSPVTCEGGDDLKKFEKLIEVRRAYRSPEVVSIRQVRVVDVKADIWAMGCVFYAMLYHQLPFTGDSKTAIVESDYVVPDSPAYEKPVLVLLRSMLEPDPAKRVDSAELCKTVLNLYSTYCTPVITGDSPATPWVDASLSRVWGHQSFGITISPLSPHGGSALVVPESPSLRQRASIGDVALWASKVTSTSMVRPKAKYVRKLVIMSWERQEAGSLPLPGFFECLQRQAVLTNSVVAYKALQTVHAMIQEGPPSFVDQALHSRSFLLSIAERWSSTVPSTSPAPSGASSTSTAEKSNASASATDRYLSEILPSYAQVLEQRLLLLRDAFVFEGNFSMGQYMQKARRGGYSMIHTDTWLGRAADVLGQTLEHGLALAGCARLALGTSGVAPSKSLLRFRETALVPLLDDLLALFGTCSFLAGIVRDTQGLHESDVGSLQRGYNVFVERVQGLIGRALDSDLVRALRKPPSLPSGIPTPTLHSPFYPTHSNVPGLAKNNVEYCEELRSFFQNRLEDAGFVVMSFNSDVSRYGSGSLGSAASSRSTASRTTLTDLERIWPSMGHSDRASTVPVHRSDRSRSSIDLQTSLHDFFADLTMYQQHAYPQQPQKPQQSMPFHAHGHQQQVVSPQQGYTRQLQQDYLAMPAKAMSRSVSPWHQHQSPSNRPSLAQHPSAPSSPWSGSEPRSRTWTKAVMRRSRTPTGLRWGDHDDVAIEWTRPSVPVNMFEVPSQAPSQGRASTQALPQTSPQQWHQQPVHLQKPQSGRPRIRQRPASAEQQSLEQTKEALLPRSHEDSHSYVLQQNAQAQRVQKTHQQRHRSLANMQRPKTAGALRSVTKVNLTPQSRPRPRTAGFKTSPFDQLVLEEQRNSRTLSISDHIGIQSFSNEDSHRISGTSQHSVSSDASEDVDEFSADAKEDENPFAVIEKSIKAAASVKDSSRSQQGWSHDGHISKHAEVKDSVAKMNSSLTMANPTMHRLTPAHSVFQTTDTMNLTEDRQSNLTASHYPSEDESVFTEDEIDLDEIVFGERIGVGGFAEVYKGEWRGTEVAIKKLLLQKTSDEALREFRKEVGILRKLRHPNIVMFMGACTRPPNLSLVTELLQMSLFDLLHSTTVKISWKIRFKMAIDTATGMNFLHRSKPIIVHRDLKSANLLLDKHYGVKVSDFGLSRVKARHYTMTGQCGTFQWMAPEVIANERYTEKADVFSYGIILWEMVSRKVPFEGMNGVQVSVAVSTRGLRPTIPADTPPGISAIMQDCWQPVPEDRPSFSDIGIRLKELRKEMFGT